jgi:Ca2+-binding RTX toxin-like protein
VLSGGKGGDKFIFKSLADGGDRITDFSAAAGDEIYLSALDADVFAKGNQAFEFVNKFTGDAGQAVLRYDAGHDRTTLKLDVDGDGRSDFALTIDGHATTADGWVL